MQNSNIVIKLLNLKYMIKKQEVSRSEDEGMSSGPRSTLFYEEPVVQQLAPSMSAVSSSFIDQNAHKFLF